ncbi:UNVERIFIED_CONTAM: hypothetical protein HDU68_003353 [Siphonaria sp. JEL0065]|nr:hypothetical protein HDU68_003353 [Siphonaria sp. JEL0065]
MTTQKLPDIVHEEWIKFENYMNSTKQNKGHKCQRHEFNGASESGGKTVQATRGAGVFFGFLLSFLEDMVPKSETIHSIVIVAMRTINPHRLKDMISTPVEVEAMRLGQTLANFAWDIPWYM